MCAAPQLAAAASHQSSSPVLVGLESRQRLLQRRRPRLYAESKADMAGQRGPSELIGEAGHT